MDIFGVELPLWVCLLVIVLTFILRWGCTGFDYFRQQGIPYETPWPFVGLSPRFIWQFGKKMDLDRSRKFGTTWGEHHGKLPVLCTTDQELIKRIMIKDFDHFQNRRPFSAGDNLLSQTLDQLTGEKWKRMRAGLSPMFSSGKIKGMAKIISECAGAVAERIRKKTAAQGEDIDLEESIGSFTLDVIASSVFDTKLATVGAENDPFQKYAREMFADFSDGWKMYIFVVFPDIAVWLSAILPMDSIKFYTKIVTELRDKRKQEADAAHVDFMKLLIQLQEKMAEDESTKNIGIDDKTFLSQAMIFLIAGYETTKTTMLITLYYLAKHQECQDKVVQEIQRVLAEHDGVIDHESAGEMQYLNGCMTEALRMTPVVPRHERVCNKAYTYGDIEIPENTIINICLYPIHYDPQIFPDPESYQPERHLPGNVTYQPTQLMPFGQGPRMCIAMRFALEEAKIGLSRLLSEFKFELCHENQPLDIKLGDQFFLGLKSFRLKVKERNDPKEVLEE